MDTIIDLFEQSCSKYPDNPYLWEKVGGKYESRSYVQVRQRVREIAGGLLYAGLKKGQRVALLAEGCADWVCCELGILYAGGINVPLSIRLNEQELIFRLNHSGCRFLFVSAYYMRTVARIIGELETVEKVYVFSLETGENEKYVPLASLAESGREWLEHNSRNLDELLSSVSADQVANIIYTSGTTAEPKGIMLTHGNFVSNVLQSDSLIQIPQHYRILLFLPWDHSFAHTVGLYSFMYNGASVAAVDFGRSPMESLRNIPVNIREIKPHILLSVPAIAKNFRKNIETEIGKKGVLVRTLYRWGLKLAYRYYGEQRNGSKGWRYLLFPLVRFFDVLVFNRIRKVFGGNLRFFIGGGALLDVELQNYFSALGVPMYQGYGLSEASPVISSNTPLK
ncbi:MAG: AMP-binding protein, partial [Odoribacter sp.]|nr:AMP-binding protein [Odoribacter sp.]